MKRILTLTVLLFSVLNNAMAQCERTQLVLSPSFYKYGNGKLGIGTEIGLLPVASKSFLTVKGSLWTRSTNYEAPNVKGQTETYTEVKSQAFVGLKLNCVPQAFESLPRKWALGAAAGFATETGKANQPAIELSSAYVIRMAAESYNGGVGYLKLEGLCLVTPTGVTPALGIGVCLLL